MVCQIKKRGWLYRCWEVTTAEGAFTVEYSGWGLGYEFVAVNGNRTAIASHAWFVPRFDFYIGSHSAVLDVSVAPWWTIRTLSLTVEDRLLYSEVSH